MCISKEQGYVSYIVMKQIQYYYLIYRPYIALFPQ